MSHDLNQCTEPKCHMHQFDTSVDKCWDHLTNEQRARWGELMDELKRDFPVYPGE